jgi:hypothetical protein
MLDRIDSLIERMENDQPIDWDKENNLLALDQVRSDRQFVSDVIERHKEQDDAAANTRSQDGRAV